MNKIRIYIIAALLLVVLILTMGIYLWHKTKDDSVAVVRNDKIELTPMQVESIKNIGQWEFLSVSDEEIVDTVKSGFLRDVRLARIYYGDLRLGINLRKVTDQWIAYHGDTLVVSLPPITLLDEKFIDEARTRPFYEDGTWTEEERMQLYNKAYRMMRSRCYTQRNRQRARQHAIEQFSQLFHNMGIEHVQVTVPQ